MSRPPFIVIVAGWIVTVTVVLIAIPGGWPGWSTALGVAGIITVAYGLMAALLWWRRGKDRLDR